MASTTLDFFMREQIKPPAKVEAKAQAPLPATQTPEQAIVKRKKRERQPYPPVAPANLPPSYFVSASYDGRLKKAVVKLYEPESGQLYFWYDNTGHLPYCLTSLNPKEHGRLTALKATKALKSSNLAKNLTP